MTECFESNKIESPRLISEMLLTHTFGGERIDLYANVNRIATEPERETLRSYVKRTLDNEPVQYIVGKTWFYGLEFNVNSSTLIPRTCTETIVDQALHVAKESSVPLRIADIGTGTGCIAVTIAYNNKTCEIVATDISSSPLALAEENAIKHNVKQQIEFKVGDGLQAISSEPQFDIICSNPPYIPDIEMKSLSPNVLHWEPKLALEGGKDGLQIIRPLIQDAPKHLVEGGTLLIEIASSTRDAVLAIAEENQCLKDSKILRDRFGDDRFLRATRC
jgi:release factor glutamine methyltransferase